MAKSKTPNKTSITKSRLNVDTELTDLELDKVAGGFSTGGVGSGRIALDGSSGLPTGKLTFSSGGGGGSGK